MRQAKFSWGCVVIFEIFLFLLFYTGYAFAQSESFSEPLNAIFISSKIENAQAIANAADKNAVTVIYDYENADLLQLALTLDELVQWKGKKIDHLIIFSHGAPGKIILTKSEVIDANQIKKKSKYWKLLSSSLSKDATIDFFGSEIGWGDAGEKLVKTLAQVTGASVRASKNPSGNINNADWNLEIKSDNARLDVPINFSQLEKTPLYF